MNKSSIDNGKQVIHNDSQVLEKILQGSRLACATITSTMGPGGGRVTYLESTPVNSFRETKDGATVAKHLTGSKDRIESHGIKLLTDASKKMADTIGDGSTTVVLLTHRILEEVFKLIQIGEKRKTIEEALSFVNSFVDTQIKSIAKRFDCDSQHLAQVATVSSGDMEIGNNITELYKKLGNEAMIVVEESKRHSDEIKIEEGYFFDKGYVSNGFLKPNSKEKEKGKIELEDAYILLYDKNITTINSLLEVINEIQQKGKPLVIIAEDFDELVLQIFTSNRQRNILNCVCIKSPGYGDRTREMLEDIAIVTGADPQFSYLGQSIEKTRLNHLGKAQKVIINNNTTTILGGNGNRQDIDARIRELNHQIQESYDNIYTREKYQERSSKLRRGIGKYLVGAADESSLKEKKDRVEDGIQASKNALKNGIVPGCGSEFLWTLVQLDKYHAANYIETLGIRILKNILRAPTETIVENAGIHDASVVINKIISNMRETNSPNNGYIIQLNNDHNKSVQEVDEVVKDIFQVGTVNPAYVSIESIAIATEKGKIFARTKFYIEDIKDENEKSVPSMMPPMM